MTITNIDWPCRQCLGRLYVSAIISVARKFSSSVAWTATHSLTKIGLAGVRLGHMSANGFSQFGFSE